MNVPERDWIYPACEFEKASGMRGISENYHMPNDMTLYEAYAHVCALVDNALGHNMSGQFSQQAILPADLPILNFLENIVALNPSLQYIDYNPQNIEQVIDFLAGITSGYNPEDIDFFLKERPSRYNDYLDALSLKIDLRIRFIPAPKTFAKIKDHFGLSDWQPTEEDLLAAREKCIDVFLTP